MAVLELQVYESINFGAADAELHSVGGLFARGDVEIDADGVETYPRTLIKNVSFCGAKEDGIETIIRSKMQGFYDGLTTEEAALVTGICPEQTP
jgi:hypothetical protein